MPSTDNRCRRVSLQMYSQCLTFKPDQFDRLQSKARSSQNRTMIKTGYSHRLLEIATKPIHLVINFKLNKIKCRIGTDPFIITPKMSLLPQSIFVVADVFMRTSAVYIYAESASIQRGVAISGARVTMRPFFSPKKKSSVSLLRGLIKGEPF